MLNIDYQKLENRLRNGIAAGAGTFAMVSVTAFRIGHEKGVALLPKKVFSFAAITGLVSAVIWSLMPKAEERPSKAIDEAKEQIYPAFKVGLNRFLQNEENLRSALTGDRTSSESKPSSPYSKPSYSTYGSSSDRSIDRVNRRYDKNFASGFESDDFEYRSRRDDVDDDFLSEDDFIEALRQEAESDPFYEGPKSQFDRV